MPCSCVDSSGHSACEMDQRPCKTCRLALQYLGPMYTAQWWIVAKDLLLGQIMHKTWQSWHMTGVRVRFDTRGSTKEFCDHTYSQQSHEVNWMHSVSSTGRLMHAYKQMITMLGTEADTAFQRYNMCLRFIPPWSHRLQGTCCNAWHAHPDLAKPGSGLWCTEHQQNMYYSTTWPIHVIHHYIHGPQTGTCSKQVPQFLTMDMHATWISHGIKCNQSVCMKAHAREDAFRIKWSIK